MNFHQHGYEHHRQAASIGAHQVADQAKHRYAFWVMAIESAALTPLQKVAGAFHSSSRRW
jgi:hypothetical protein